MNVIQNQMAHQKPSREGAVRHERARGGEKWKATKWQHLSRFDGSVWDEAVERALAKEAASTLPLKQAEGFVAFFRAHRASFA